MKSKNGSCVLILVLVSSISLLYYFNMWHSIVLNKDLIFKKCEYEKKFRMIESFHNFNIVFCINHFDQLYSKKNEKIEKINIYKGFWPINFKSYFGLSNIILKDDFKILIVSSLVDSINNSKLSIQSFLTKENDLSQKNIKKKSNLQKFIISDWQINNEI